MKADGRVFLGCLSGFGLSDLSFLPMFCSLDAFFDTRVRVGVLIC